MQIPLIIYWPDEWDEYVFASHTSLINVDTLNKVIEDAGIELENFDSNNS